jgi:hypothetical protein
LGVCPQGENCLAGANCPYEHPKPPGRGRSRSRAKAAGAAPAVAQNS